jgi:hypothetical protein
MPSLRDVAHDGWLCSFTIQYNISWNFHQHASEQLMSEDRLKSEDREVAHFMYRRPILCTLYGAVDFLNVLKKYIMYLHIGDGDM